MTQDLSRKSCRSSALSCPAPRPLRTDGKDEPYKVELIDEHCRQGRSDQLLLQPGRVHRPVRRPAPVTSTGRIKGNGIKITNVTGAYWRGDAASARCCSASTAPAFPKARTSWTRTSHALRRPRSATTASSGKELGLFTIMDEGPGFPFFLPKGMVLQATPCIDYWREVPQALRLCGDLHPDHPQPASCGSAPATGTTIRTTCTPPSSTARTTPSSR